MINNEIYIDMSQEIQRINKLSKLLELITLMQSEFLKKGIVYGWCDKILENLLQLTESEFGFICELLHKEDGTPFIKSHGISNIAWNTETRKFYEANIEKGLEFFNFKSIWGQAITTGKSYISTNPDTDPHRGGYPKENGHPQLKGFLALPIKDTKDRVIGVMGIANNPKGYDQELIDFLSPFVSTYGMLIEKDRLDIKEKNRKKELLSAKEESEESEKRLKTILDSSPFPTAVVDVNDDKISYWSKSAVELFGHNPNTTQEWYELAYPDPDYRQEAVERWKPFLEKAQGSLEAVNTGEYKIVCKDGSVKSCELYAQFIPGNLIVTLNDITDRKKAEEQLKSLNQQLQADEQQLRATNQQLKANDDELKKRLLSEKELADIVRETPVAIAFGYPDGRLEKCNAAFSKLTGYSITELQQIDWNEELTPSKWKDHEGEMLSQLCPEKISVNYEKEYIRKDGSIVPIELTVTAKFDMDGNIVHYIGFISDISEWKLFEFELIKAKEKAEESEKQLLEAQKIAHLGSFQRIIATGETIWSDEEFRIYGSDPAMPSPDYDTILKESILPEDAQLINETFNKAIQTQSTFELEHRIVLPDGSIRWVYDKSQPYFNEHGELERYNGVTLDITERKKAEEQLKSLNQQLQANEQQLRAANQQLQANEQQLRASNQQLIASEQQLRASETKYRSLFNSMQEGVYLHSLVYNDQGEVINYRIIDANIVSEKYLNIKREDAIGKLGTELFETEEAPFLAMYSKVAETGEPTTFEQYFPPMDKYFLISVFSPSKGEFATVFLDISNIKKTEAELIKAKEKAEESELQLKAANQQLQANEQELIGAKETAERYLDMAGSIFLSLDQKANIILVNQKALEILEYNTSEELIGKNWFDTCIPPEINEQIKQVFAKVVKGDMEGVEQFENEVVTKSGKRKLIDWHNSYIKGEKGQVEYLFSSGLDITERKKSEEELRNIEWMLSKKKLLPQEIDDEEYTPEYGDLTLLNTNRLIHDSVGADVLKDIASDYLSLLDTSSAIYEKNGDYALGIFSSGWCRFMDKASYKLCNTDNSKEALNSGKWLCHESCWRDSSLAAINSGSNTDIECSGGIRMYAEPIRAGEKIIGSINFGYGNPPQDKQKLLELAQKYNVPVDELIKKAKEYKTRPSYMIELAKNRLKATSKLIGEIVSRKMADQQLKKTNIELLTAKEKAEESDRLKSAFLANMSHEIRTPMNGILGFTDLLKDVDLTGDQHEKYIKVIEQSGERMLNTINDIIDISRIESGEVKVNIQATNINTQLENLYDFFKPEAEKKNIALNYKESLGNHLASIQTDPEKFDAIFINLIKNALKFTKKGSIDFGYRLEDKKIHCYVKDTGVGISSDKLESVFERFIQEKKSDASINQGSGLGLSIVKAYVGLLGGEIWLESVEGKGSTFHFTLPYNAVKKETPARELNAEAIMDKASNFSNKTILVVEDDDASYEFLKIVLNNLEINNIAWAKNGKEAIKHCKENAAIDLVLMDINLPVMSGYEATKEIKTFRPSLPIIAQTAYALAGDREKSIEVGCDDYIPKPIKKENLLEILSNHF